MSTSTIVWIIVAVVVVAIVIAVAVALSRRSGARRIEAQRAKAEEIREKAAVDEVEVRRREAEAARLDAQARLAQAEADARSADAAALAQEARSHGEQADGARADLDERLGHADRIDPDVPTTDDARAEDRPGDVRDVDDVPVERGEDRPV